MVRLLYVFLFFFKQTTAYEMRISDWSSDVCSSDLSMAGNRRPGRARGQRHQRERAFVQVRVRHAQARLVDHRVAEQQQVEVERARAPARIVLVAVAAELALDGQ